MFKGEKVLLREYREGDIQKATEMFNDAETRTYIGSGPFPASIWQEEKFIKGQDFMSRDSYNYAIETLEDGEYIGGCGINKMNWTARVAEVGIMIGDKAYWGQGYGTDAMKVLIRIIFEYLNMNKISLYLFSYNKRAQASYEKCGFVVEGVLRQEQYAKGGYHDQIYMGLLREEWEKQQ